MPTRRLTDAQIQAAKNAAVAYFATVGIEIPAFEAAQIEELLRHPSKTMLVYLPQPNQWSYGGVFIDNIEPGYVMSIHNKGGQKLPGDTTALMREVNRAVAEVTYDPIDVCVGAAEAYTFLLELEFARRDVGQIELGYMTIYMFHVQNDQSMPANVGIREGRRLAYEAFQAVVAEGRRVLDSSLLADCLIALLAVVLQLQPPEHMSGKALVDTLLARLSTNGGTDD